MYSSNRSLYCFMVAAEELNFTRAADKLFMTQQALSSHIKKLEQQYDTVLFERRPRLRLTPAGAHLLSYAKKTIQNERSLMRYLQDDRRLEQVRLPIGIASLRAKTFIPQILINFRELYPNVVPSFLRASNFNCDSMLRSGKISLYFGMYTPSDFYGERFELIPDKLYFTVSRVLLEQVLADGWQDFLERNAAGLSPEDASTLPLILPGGDSELRPTLDRYLEQSALPYNTITEVSGQDVMLELCAKGYGACFISHSVFYSLRSMYREDQIYAFPVPDLTGLHDLSIFYDNSGGAPQYVADFIECSKITVENIGREIEEHLPKLQSM